MKNNPTKEEILANLRNSEAQAAANQRFYQLIPQLYGETAHHQYTMVDPVMDSLGEELSVIEIGSWHGFSVCFFSTNQHVAKVISVEWGGDHTENLKKNIAKFAKNYRLFLGNSRDSQIKREVEELGQVDFLFIDGCHLYTCVQADFRNYHQCVRTGGVIAFDDYGTYSQCPEVRPAIDDLYTNGEFSGYEVIGDAVTFYETGQRSNLYFLLKK